MQITALSIVFMLGAAALVADDRHVDFDRHTDFSTLKTFALREGKVDSVRPELNNTLLLKKIGDAIRTELTKKGLKETLNSPDIAVDYNISAEEFLAQRGGPVERVEGTLVIDLVKRDSKALIWRGVYRDSESNNPKLASNLPGDVQKLVADYPPRQKGPIVPGPSALTITKLTPKAAAAAALEIIQSIRKDTAFIGPDAHPGLSISLAGLERIARVVSEDDGKSPAATSNRNESFYKELSDAADYAASIAARGVETPDSRAKARKLAGDLRTLSGS